MKSRVKLSVCLLTLILIMSGCMKQVAVNEKFSKEENNASLLNVLSNYQYEGTDCLELSLQTIEIKLDNKLKGKVAFVYTKDFNEDELTLKVAQSFKESKEAEYEKSVISSLNDIIADLEDVKVTIEKEYDEEDNKRFDGIIDSYKEFLSNLQGSKVYAADELLNVIKEHKEIIETFLSQTAASYYTPQESLVNELSDKTEVFEILNRTFNLAEENASDYKTSNDYSDFFNKIVKEFNDDVLRHYDVNNNYEELINWAEEEIVKASNGVIDHLYIINEDIGAKEIENEIKSNNEEYNYYLDKELYKSISDNVDELTEAYKNQLLEAETHLKNISNIKGSLENIKGVKLQKSITSLNTLLQKIREDIQDSIVEAAISEVSLEFKDIVKKENNSFKYQSGDQNDNEVFFVFEFDNLSDLYNNVYIDSVKNAASSGIVKNEILKEMTATKLKYIGYELKSPHLKAVTELVEDINKRTDIVNTIKLDGEADSIKTELVNWGRALDKTYEEEVKKIQLYIEEGLVSANEDEAKSLEDEFNNQFSVLNKHYEELIQSKLNETKNALMALQQNKNITEVIDIINGFDSIVEDKEGDLKSIDEIVEEFESLYVAYFRFDEKIPYNIRISLNGAIINKLNSSGQPSLQDNFHINAEASGTKTVRIIPGSENSMFLFKLNHFGYSEFIILLILLVVLLIILFFVNKKWFRKVLYSILLVLIAVIIIYPVMWIIGSSFNKSDSLLSVGISPIPKNGSLIQFERLFKTTQYGHWYLNTFKIAVINMIVSVIATVLLAFVFSRFKFKGKKFGLMTILILQVFPSFIGMVAIYILLSRITFFSWLTGTTSLINTHLGLILVYASGQIPYNTWLVKGYFDTIPKSLDEASRIDGASNFRIFWQIILPLGRPIIAFAAVTNFMAPWMEFIFSRLVLISPEKKTLALGLFEMINNKSDTAFTMFAAGTVLVAVPITLLFSYFQKYIVAGLASGAVKE